MRTPISRDPVRAPAAPQAAFVPPTEPLAQRLLGARLHLHALIRFGVAGVLVVAAVLGRYVVGISDLDVRGLAWLAAAIVAYDLVAGLLIRPYRTSDTAAGHHRRLLDVMHATVVLSFLALTGVLWFTGGLRSPFAAFFLLHMMLTSLLLTAREAVASAVLACALLAGLVWVELAGVLPPERPAGIAGPDPLDPRLAIVVLAVYELLFGVVAYLLIGLATVMRGGEAQLRGAYAALERLSGLRRDFLDSAIHNMKAPGTETARSVILAAIALPPRGVAAPARRWYPDPILRDTSGVGRARSGPAGAFDRRRESSMIGIRGMAAIVAGALAVGACAPQESAESTQAMERATFDSLLADLAGPQAERLSDGQRWRLVASTATGLPPTSYRLADLPEPEARGASLQQVYCVQCHGIASPKMHTVEEWPILIRRMVMRARTLRDRLQGSRIEGQVDEMLMAGLQYANIPSAEDQDSLIAYFTRHGLPGAAPGEIGDGPDAQLYLEYCTLCHEAPSPTAHGPDGAQALVYRMSAMMQILGMQPPDEAQKERLVTYLQAMAE